jgi:hypothetical protein
MIDFIIENKEWLFSGLGVSALTVIVLIVRHIILARKKKESSDIIVNDVKQPSVINTHLQEDTSIIYSKDPTPNDIAKEIAKLPPYQQGAAENNFVGLKVRWDLSLSLVHLRDNDEVILTCNFKGYSRYVDVATNLQKYPQIKIAKEGQNLTTYGVITGIDPSGPVVCAHKIEFR